MEELSIISKEEYNNEPVYYCPKCLSLRIKSLTDEIDYCDECGSTEIQMCHIDEWRELRQKFNKEYI